MEVYNKANPGKSGRPFYTVRSDVDFYVYHPKVTPFSISLYTTFVQLFNVNLGYAYPSISKLCIHHNASRDTITKHIKILREVGLITRIRQSRYVPNEPMIKEKFFNHFPDAEERYKEVVKREFEHAKSADQRKDDFVKQYDEIDQWLLESFNGHFPPTNKL